MKDAEKLIKDFKEIKDASNKRDYERLDFFDRTIEVRLLEIDRMYKFPPNSSLQDHINYFKYINLISYGDCCMKKGDLNRARQKYEMAKTLAKNLKLMVEAEKKIEEVKKKIE
ncbi:hypothetical protein GMMP15_1100006 [Candidatus Magnetomoraceae bacterium gMMP-15]